MYVLTCISLALILLLYIMLMKQARQRRKKKMKELDATLNRLTETKRKQAIQEMEPNQEPKK